LPYSPFLIDCENPQPVVIALTPSDSNSFAFFINISNLWLSGHCLSHHQPDGIESRILYLTGKLYEFVFPTFPGISGACISNIKIPNAYP